MNCHAKHRLSASFRDSPRLATLLSAPTALNNASALKGLVQTTERPPPHMLGTYCEHAVHILCILAGLPNLDAISHVE